MQQEQDSPKPSFDAGSLNLPETAYQQSPASATSEKDRTLDESLNDLILSARKTGWSECMNEVTKLMMEIARMDNPKQMLAALVKGCDAISKQGTQLNA